MTYYIRHAENPAGRAEFFIVHNVGSLQEEENQRGLAHFLEHMAFNGTKHFPKKLLLEYFASIGVKFGNNINAYTSMERTVYNISAVPLHRESIIDSALLALHDWSHYISCEPEEIEAERGVVREEWRRGDDARTRMMKGIMRVEQTGSRFAQRDVIGLPEIINTFTRETLVDYYHKWYRPDLQAVIVVGDIDVEAMEKKIIDRFSQIPKVENGAVRESYTIPVNKKPIVGFNTDPESKAVSVRMTIRQPHLSPEKRTTAEALYVELVKDIFLDMFKVRCEAACASNDSLARNLIPVYGNISYASGSFTTTTLPFDNKSTLKALKALFIEIERVSQHGFDADEFKNAATRVKLQWEKSYDRIKNPKNDEYVTSAVSHFTRQYPLVDIDKYFAMAKEIIGKITLDNVNQYVPKIITDENRVIIFAVPENDKQYLPTEDDVLSLLDEVQSTQLDRFELAAEKSITLDKVPQPGRIIKSRALTSKNFKIKYEKELDSTYEWLLDNGARIIWKETYGGDKEVRMEAFRPGGYALPDDIYDSKALAQFLSKLTINGLSRGEITKWSARNRASITPSMGYRTNNIAGNFNPNSSEEFFKLLHLYFTDVEIRERDLESAKAQILKGISGDRGELNTFKDSVAKIRYSYSPANIKFDSAYINSISADKIEKLYAKQYMNPAGYTFVFTGPMDSNKGKELVIKYISSIKEGKFKAPKLKYKEPVAKDGEVYLRYKAKNMLSTKAEVNRTYHANIDYTPYNALMAKFITYILRDRYMSSIREERGGTYHVGVTTDFNKYPTPLIRFNIEFDTDPALVDELIEVVQQEIDEFVKRGPTEKEMKEIMLYLTKVHQDKKDITPWSTIIVSTITGEENLTIDEKLYLDKMDAKEIQKFAKSIFEKKNRMTFIFEPEG